MLSTPIVIGSRELQLRYENKQQADIKHNAPKKVLGDIKNLRFGSPMDILSYLGDTDVQIYLLKKSLEWPGSGIDKITEDIAADLRQEYLEDGEPDAGEKLEAFQELLADALSKNVIGASGKKLKERGLEAVEKAKGEEKKAKVEELATMYEAKILAEERAKLKMETNPPGQNGEE
jgi:hypothetical protein